MISLSGNYVYFLLINKETHLYSIRIFFLNNMFFLHLIKFVYFHLFFYYSTQFSTLADAVYAESSHIILICLHLFLTPNTLLLREMHLFSRKPNELLFNNYVIALRTALSFLLSIFCRLYMRLCVFLMIFFFVLSLYGCCCRSNSNRN